MNVPSLPTDNLYKFLAIFGIVICIFSIYIYQNKYNLYTEEFFEVRKEFAKYGPMLDRVTLLLERIETDPSDKSLPENKKLFAATLDAIDKLNQEIKTGHEIAEYSKEKEERAWEEIRILWKYSKIFFFIGVLMSIVGFYLWYVKVQKPLDKLLKKQLEDEPNGV